MISIEGGETLSEGVVVTHDEVFHADDVVAVAIRSLAGPTSVIRTRDPFEIEMAHEKGALVLDVGGQFDGDRRLDHHTRGWSKRRANGVPLASAGIAWNILFWAHITTDQELAERLDLEVIQAVDAVDCGAVTGFKTLRGSPNTRLPDLGLSRLISSMNSRVEPHGSDQAFEQAVYFAREVLLDQMREINLRLASERRVRHIAQGLNLPIVVLDQYEPAAMDVLAEEPETLFFVYPGIKQGWRVQQVPKTVGSFEGRKQLPEAWAGLREDELTAVTGVADAVFCHPGRFIAGARSKAGAVRLAELALHAAWAR